MHIFSFKEFFCCMPYVLSNIFDLVFSYLTMYCSLKCQIPLELEGWNPVY